LTACALTEAPDSKGYCLDGRRETARHSWVHFQTRAKGNLMNNIVYIVGAIVIIVALLSFFGLR
jgi:hypothetical protein